MTVEASDGAGFGGRSPVVLRREGSVVGTRR